MKVQVCLSKLIECEIDDKFAILANPEVSYEDIPEKLYMDCLKAAEKALNIPCWDRYMGFASEAEKSTGVILNVQSDDGHIMAEV